MQEPYGKFYAKTFTGSMAGTGAHVIAVMGYCVANAKPPDGNLEINTKLLAVMIGEPEERIKEAVEFLCSPDTESRTPTDEGRRLVRVGQFMYRLVNWEAHRGGIDRDARRETWRNAKADYRSKKKTVSEGKNIGIGAKPIKADHPIKVNPPVDNPAAARADVDLPDMVVPSNPPSAPPTVEEIYQAYPKKADKPAALRAIKKAILKMRPEALMELTRKYAKVRESCEPQFTPYPASWYNAERFNDDEETWGDVAGKRGIVVEGRRNVNTANEGVAARDREKYWVNPDNGQMEPKMEFAHEYPGFCRKLLERGVKLTKEQKLAVSGYNEPEVRTVPQEERR